MSVTDAENLTMSDKQYRLDPSLSGRYEQEFKTCEKGHSYNPTAKTCGTCEYFAKFKGKSRNLDEYFSEESK